MFNDEYAGILPERGVFAYYVEKAYQCKEKNDDIGFFENLITAVKKDQSMNDIVAFINKKLKPPEPEPQPNAKLDDEIKALKNAINVLIGTGKYEKANQIIISYEQINPTDPDIETMKNEIAANREAE